MIREAIGKLIEGEHLTAVEAETVMDEIMRGEGTQAQIGAFLTALRLKGETVDEITGCARSMRRAAIAVRPRRTDLVDTCGTGGDKVGTFNISTTTAFVVAGAGLAVAKHGNRSVSSRSGSADVLQALGVNLDLVPAAVAECVDECGIGFLFAPRFHPAMRHAIGPRRELGIRTVFNVLGPLTNPAGAVTQLVGVYDPALVGPLAGVLLALGSRAAFVVHGADGLDELTTTGPNHISYFGCNGANGRVVHETLDPATLGFERATLADLLGGDAETNAAITRGVLDGTIQGPKRDVVLLNAAAALVAGGRAHTLGEGLELAATSIDSGAASATLDRLVATSQRLAANQPA